MNKAICPKCNNPAGHVLDDHQYRFRCHRCKFDYGPRKEITYFEACGMLHRARQKVKREGNVGCPEGSPLHQNDQESGMEPGTYGGFIKE